MKRTQARARTIKLRSFGEGNLNGMSQKEREFQSFEGDGASTLKIGKLSLMLAYIDKQAPSLTYLGFALWMAWNTIAFSGTAWFYDPERSIIVEELISQHLIACICTSLVLAITAKKSMYLTAQNWFTLLGGIIAAAGTAMFIFARGETDIGQALFIGGTICSGVGTTFLFMRAVPLLGALPPRQVLVKLAGCVMLSYAVFFMVSSCPWPLGSILFVLIPIVSALLYCVRSTDMFGEEQVLHTDKPFAPMFALLVVSIVFCGASFDLVRSFLLINLEPAASNLSQVYAGVVNVFVFAAILVITLLTKPNAVAGAKRLYTTVLGILAIFLAVFVFFMPQGIAGSACAHSLQTVFNMTVWAMFAYIVYQSKSNAVSIFGFGNAALSLGTLVACRLSMVFFYEGADYDLARVILAVLCVCMIAFMLFIFPDKNLDKVLPPIEDSRLDADANAVQVASPNRAGKWQAKIEEIAEKYRLSPREKVVFTALAQGKTQQQIADRECVSIHTIRSQARSIHIKLGVHSKREMDELIEQEMGSDLSPWD